MGPVGPDRPRISPPTLFEVDGPLVHVPGTRRFYTTSSCGVCGKGALEEVAVHSGPLSDGPVVARALVASLPDRLEQPAFERTGGLHATGLFDPSGALIAEREDVGRHNAMDKVIGTGAAGWPGPARRSGFCASAAGCPLSSSRRRLWPARRSWSGSAPRALWPSHSLRPRDDAVRLCPGRGR